MIGKTIDYSSESSEETTKGSGRVVSISRSDLTGYMADLEDGTSVSVYDITSIK